MPEFLQIDPAGRLTADTGASRRYLADRGGRWRIVPSARDVVLLRRDAVGAEGPPVRAVLSGDVGGFGLGELLAFLAQSRWTGVVTVVQDAVEKSIFLKHGSVRWAASNLPADRLGEVVRRLGLVDAARVEQALSDEAGSGLKLGQVLLRRGLLDAAGLYRALRHQVEEIFHSLLLMEHGAFFLFNDPVEGRFAAQIALDLNGLLMDGLRRIDERAQFRRRIPGPEAYAVRREVRPDNLDARERAVWEALDGRRTVAEVGEAAHLPEFEVEKALYGLAEAGLVDVHAERPEAVLGRSVDRLRPEVREVVRVFNTVFREIHGEVARVAPTTGFRLGAESFLAGGHHGDPALFEGLTLDEDGMIPEEALLTNLARDPGGRDPALRLYEALNELMFFELFQAGEILPPDRDDDLSRRVKLIYEMLNRDA